MIESELCLFARPDIRLKRIAEENREALRAAAAEDPAIWEIYSTSLLGAAFDGWWRERSAADAAWRMFTVHQLGADGKERLVGMTGFFPDPRHPGVVEVGSSYLVPAVRGSHVNPTMKWLILSHVFAQGAHRVEIRSDARNVRSIAAAKKLGAKEEAVLHHHKITHTGFIRDTYILAILDKDWPDVERRLRARLQQQPGARFG